MIKATISEVKNGLSAYLRRVRAGETVVIMDRKTPVANLVPAASRSGSEGGADGDDAMLERLLAAGLVVRAEAEDPREVLRDPVVTGSSALSALLDERRSGR